MGLGPQWSPEAPPKAYRLSCSCPAWRLLGSQLGASPEPEPLGYGGLSHLRPCTSMPYLAVWLRACPFAPPPSRGCVLSPLGPYRAALPRRGGLRGCPGWPLA